MTKKFQKGMTLIELIVAMGIFMVVITLAVGGFVTLLRLQRKSLIMRETQQNARIALEVISKETRQAKIVKVKEDGERLELRIKGSDPLNLLTDYTVYYYIDQKMLKREQLLGTSTPTNISSPNVEVKNLLFIQQGALLSISFDVSDVGDASTYDQDTTTIATTIILEGEKEG